MSPVTMSAFCSADVRSDGSHERQQRAALPLPPSSGFRSRRRDGLCDRCRKGRCACRVRKRVADDAFEGLERLGAGQVVAIDHERRGAVNARVVGEGFVFCQHAVEAPVRLSSAQAPEIQAQRGCGFGQRFVAQRGIAANSKSWNFQKPASPFWARTSRATIAAGRARSWKGSG